MRLTRKPGQDPRATVDARTARTAHECGQDFAHDRRIAPGDRYLVVTEFPGGESGEASGAGYPVRMLLCARCADGFADAPPAGTAHI